MHYAAVSTSKMASSTSNCRIFKRVYSKNHKEKLNYTVSGKGNELFVESINSRLNHKLRTAGVERVDIFLFPKYIDRWQHARVYHFHVKMADCKGAFCDFLLGIIINCE